MFLKSLSQISIPICDSTNPFTSNCQYLDFEDIPIVISYEFLHLEWTHESPFKTDYHQRIVLTYSSKSCVSFDIYSIYTINFKNIQILNLLHFQLMRLVLTLHMNSSSMSSTRMVLHFSILTCSWTDRRKYILALR